MKDLKSTLQNLTNKYVCINTRHWEQVKLAQEWLDTLDDIWLEDIIAYIDEDPTNDSYDIVIFMEDQNMKFENLFLKED